MSNHRLVSVSTWLTWITEALEGVVARPRREAQLLLMAHLQQDELWLMMHEADLVEEGDKLQVWLERRQRNEPLEYITNSVSFYSETFFIQEGALIPRPETELLIDLVLANVDVNTTATFVEVGVGSGIISIMLAKHLPHAKFIGVDISLEALAVARINIEKFGLSERIVLRESNLLSAVREKIDFLVSNPPYIADDEPLASNLDYEPDLALFGGHIGDEIIQKLLDAVYQREIPFFVCEMGYDQEPKLKHYLREQAFKRLEFYKDLAGLDRGFILEK